MEKKAVTIQTHAFKKEEVDLRSFECQVIKVNGSRTYVFNATEQDLADIAPGCKIFEDGEVYRVLKIFYRSSTKYAFIIIA